MSDKVIVRVRIDPDIKEKASAVFAENGLTISDAIRLFLTYVARYQRLPFEIEESDLPKRKAAKRTK